MEEKSSSISVDWGLVFMLQASCADCSEEGGCVLVEYYLVLKMRKMVLATELEKPVHHAVELDKGAKSGGFRPTRGLKIVRAKRESA
jgi:hypothetical protein